ncbi:MAG: DUF5703 domain-containing protein [Akkermansiaceae bacterium]|nr:DUF5703 domain-containing protein [Akkermansiaceae bacterium]
MKWTSVLMMIGCHFLAGAAPSADLLDSYNVVWDSPSENAHGSMPLGNGDGGINAWVEPSGDLGLYLLPAWPKNWDVSFKLHAPCNTTVEGVYKAGKLEKLKITPESRLKDVVRILNQKSR